MINNNFIKDFKEIWLVDFEFSCPPGEKPTPVCMVAIEKNSRRKIRLFKEELTSLTSTPFSIDKENLYVAYYASAEFSCHLTLNWELPFNVLDLFCEFRNFTNGKDIPSGNGLIGALTYFGLNSLDAVEKKEMRDLAMRGGEYTDSEKHALLDYCEADVKALDKLIEKMLPYIDLPRALIRGSYIKSVAHIENHGVPIDKKTYLLIKEKLPNIKDKLIQRVDPNGEIYEGTTFKLDKFTKYLVNKNISWPQLPSGHLALDDETFKYMAKIHQDIYPLHELRVLLSQIQSIDLPIGKDNRNRTLLSQFRSKTGRNQPSNSNFIFGFSAWWRHLIKPENGYGLAYVDWSQQEFGIAAALSKDEKMMEAYTSGDPYLAFAIQAGEAPIDATKKSHSSIREKFKACALAVQYGMSPVSLAQRINKTSFEGRELLTLHKETYPKFWTWSEAAVDTAMLYSKINTVFGWTYFVGDNSNHRSLRNFPVQANGAEILRLAACLAIDRGVKICAPIHDAFLIEAPLNKLDEAIMLTQQAMEDASSIVLDGFKLRSDVKVFKYPERYEDERGTKMWNTILDLIKEEL